MFFWCQLQHVIGSYFVLGTLCWVLANHLQTHKCHVHCNRRPYSRHICWSRKMKEVGLHVTFVRGNLATVATSFLTGQSFQCYSSSQKQSFVNWCVSTFIQVMRCIQCSLVTNCKLKSDELGQTEMKLLWQFQM